MKKFELTFTDKNEKEVTEIFTFDKKLENQFTINKILAVAGKIYGKVDLTVSGLDSMGPMMLIGYELMKLCTSHNLKKDVDVDDYFQNDYENYATLVGDVLNFFLLSKSEQRRQSIEMVTPEDKPTEENGN